LDKPDAPRTGRKKRAEPARAQPTRAKAREGKVAVVGYFSPELSTRLHTIKAQERSSIQALLGEAIDMLLEDRGYPAAVER
jgi:hypothetical protein